jgi:Domain of unknown function (DUF5666)
MNDSPTEPTSKALRAVLALSFAALALAGCGGGGTGTGGPGTSAGPTAGTSSFTSGPITGFGSVIVNGVRFDDDSARISSDDDDANESRGRGDLKLGMVVEIRSGAITSGASGRVGSAREIRFGSEIVGPVDAGSIDAAARTFSLLGQKVRVSDSTVFDDSLAGGFGAITVGAILEVHGLLDAAGATYNATRIEAEPAASQFKLRGAIAGLDPAAKTFTIGGELISYAALVPPPTGLADGQIVRVKLAKTQVNGAWVATRLKNGVRKPDDLDEAEIKGTISNFTTITQPFNVNGIAVDASQAANVPAGLANGVIVEVKGRAQAGTIIAVEVEIEDGKRAGAGEFELHGLIESRASGANAFVLRGMTIGFDATTLFERGATPANLKAGDRVEVRAISVSGSTTLHATRIKFDN